MAVHVRARRLVSGAEVWDVIAYHNRTNGKRTFQTKDTAEKVADIIRQQIDRDNVFDFSRIHKDMLVSPTVTEMIRKALDIHTRKRSIGRNTQQLYESAFKTYFAPINRNKNGSGLGIGHLRVTSVKGWMVADYLDALTKAGKKHATIQRVLLLLRLGFDLAKFRELVEKNPCEDVLKYTNYNPKKGKRADDFDLFKPFEVAAIIKYAYEINPLHGRVIEFLSMVPARVGEALALGWSDIRLNARNIAIGERQRDYPEFSGKHLEYGSINVEKSFSRDVVGPIKTKAANRRLLPPLDLAVKLITWRGEHRDRQLTLPDDKRTDLLFHNSKGLHIRQRILTRTWHRTQEAALIDRRALHMLRHTLASTALQSGVPLLFVSQQLGHKNPQVTLAEYSRYIDIKGVGGSWDPVVCLNEQQDIKSANYN